ncbi:5-(carboxyamino)imidazole ribonucleotide mutase [Candidatus Poribacteria bacterium]|nr:5-(carboxyamino)imidazole ribonucleotide mutase [Candidatus Poribacteria bacterium]
MTGSVTRPPQDPDRAPCVAVVMGSRSDLEIMDRAVAVLEVFGVESEVLILSAHRTPDDVLAFAEAAEGKYDAIIAGAGGAAHLPGVIAAKTIVPVIGVPLPTSALNGMDALLSMAQMPAGVPVATMALGEPGAANAGLFAIHLLALTIPDLAHRLKRYRARMARDVRRDHSRVDKKAAAGT